ncbi:uncharacterized protein LOC106672267 isoform X2 [Cimex lectularius]|nr:uncharacterized protein LOC106672267 isoform X2 [Cimex lectularius]
MPVQHWAELVQKSQSIQHSENEVNVAQMVEESECEKEKIRPESTHSVSEPEHSLVRSEHPIKHESKSFEKKLQDLSHKIVLTADGMKLNEKPKDVNEIEYLRGKKRRLAFMTRFKRHYHYQLVCQINEIKKIPRNDNIAKTKRYVIAHKFVAAYQTVLYALIALEKHMLASCFSKKSFSWVKDFFEAVTELWELLHTYDIIDIDSNDTCNNIKLACNRLCEKICEDKLAEVRTVKKTDKHVCVYKPQKGRKNIVKGKNAKKNEMAEEAQSHISVPESGQVVPCQSNKKESIDCKWKDPGKISGELQKQNPLTDGHEENTKSNKPTEKSQESSKEGVTENVSKNIKVVCVKYSKKDQDNKEKAGSYRVKPNKFQVGKKNLRNYRRAFNAFKIQSDWYDDYRDKVVDRVVTRLTDEIIKEVVEEINVDDILKKLIDLELKEI